MSRQVVSEHDRQWHQFIGLAAGVAEHHSLIAGAQKVVRIVVPGLRLERSVDAERDIRRLLVDGDAHAAGFSIESDRRTRVSHVADHLANELGNIDVGFRGHLAGDVNLSGDRKRFHGNARVRIVLDERVEDRIGDLIGQLVGMPLGNRFAREELPIGHLRAFTPGGDVLDLLGGERIDVDAHR